MTTTYPLLLNGEWRPSTALTTFQAINPKTGETLPGVYPVSTWGETEAAIHAAASAFAIVRNWPGERFAAFLEAYATAIEGRAADLVAIAHAETGLPVEPRLAKAELPRTTNQLRQAAKAARDGSWLRPVIDTAANIRSIRAAIGPVVVFGPNNFPFAFNGIAGGDFAAAVAAGCPVIAKAHSSHPGTSRLLAELAHDAAKATGMPPGFVQVIYRLEHVHVYTAAVNMSMKLLGTRNVLKRAMNCRHLLKLNWQRNLTPSMGNVQILYFP